MNPDLPCELFCPHSFGDAAAGSGKRNSLTPTQVLPCVRTSSGNCGVELHKLLKLGPVV